MSKLKGFIGETIVYGFASVFSRVFAMLLIPFYASFLGKVEYSNLVMLQSLFSALTFLMALNSGVFFYYYEYRKVKYQKMVFTSWFYYQLVIASLITLSLFLFSDFVKEILIVTDDNSSQLVGGVILIGVQLFPYMFNITNINLFRIDRSPKPVMYIVFLEALITFIFVGLGFYYFEFNIIGVFTSQIAARIVVSLLFLNKSKYYIDIRFFSFKILKKLFLFAWPFLVISLFSWGIISMDKFFGAEALSNKDEVAILALAMQLSIPLMVLADMIRMAIGPFIMSIRKDKDADKNYQQIFDLTIFSAFSVLIVIVVLTPFLTVILTDKTYLPVIQVVPLIAFGGVISLVENQFSISFSLVKKNVYILYATIVGSVLNIVINYVFMKEYGFIVSGISQIISFSAMALILFIIGKRVTELNLKFRNSLILFLITIAFISIVYFFMEDILNEQYTILILSGGIALPLLCIGYMYTQKISFKKVVQYFVKKSKG